MKNIRKNPTFCLSIFIIGIISIVLAFLISSVKPANAAIKGVSEMTGVRYETVYVGGNRFLVFSNSTGSDIEVFPY